MKKAGTQEVGPAKPDHAPSAKGRGIKTRLRWLLIGTVLGVALSMWAGESLHGPIRSVARHTADVSSALWDRYTEARSSARNMGLEQQITSRFEGDKSIEADQIQVSVEAEGVVTLKGIVADKSVKEKAMELARDTRGVKKVVDHLAILPSPRVVTSPSDADGIEAPALAERPTTRR